MRWGRAIAVSVVVVALAACGGGGKKSNATATGSASNGSQLSAGSDAAPGASEGASVGADQNAAGDSPVVGADGASSDGGAAQPAGSGDAPAPPGLKPFAGTYTFHATGTTSLNGSASNVDAQAVATVEDLSDTDQRTTTSGGGGPGDQVQVLRYSNDKVELVSLEMKGAVHKVFNGPVLFAPVPGSIGQTWAWDLTSDDHLTHVHQSSRYDRTETVTVGGQSVDAVVVETDLSFSGDINGSGHLTSWVSMAYKMSVRNHSTLDATYGTFHFTNDVTADLLDLRPS
jgi:hypothetical protein